MRVSIGVLSDVLVEALGDAADAVGDDAATVARMAAAAARVPDLDADTLLTLALLVADRCGDPVDVGRAIADAMGVP